MTSIFDRIWSTVFVQTKVHRIPPAYEILDLAPEFADIAEGPVMEDLAFNDPEPHLYKVHPHHVCRGGLDADPRIRSESVPHLLRFGVIVRHQVFLIRVRQQT